MYVVKDTLLNRHGGGIVKIIKKINVKFLTVFNDANFI
jgi:hypothetical protein